VIIEGAGKGEQRKKKRTGDSLGNTSAHWEEEKKEALGLSRKKPKRGLAKGKGRNSYAKMVVTRRKKNAQKTPLL